MDDFLDFVNMKGGIWREVCKLKDLSFMNLHVYNSVIILITLYNLLTS